MDATNQENTDAAAEPSVFHSSLSVETKIERARMELLDLSARNRLLNVPRFSKSAKTIDIVDEKSVEIYRILVTQGKPMTFLAGAKGRDGDNADEEGMVELALPDDDERDENGRLVRHADTKLQTRMTPNGLQKRLLDLYFDARLLEEEQGVNILFLGLGTLKWIDPNNAENIRYAPLLLVPVSLERASAGERFKLRARNEDVASNLSLEAYLDRVHTIKMPDFDPSDEFSVDEYFNKIAAAVSIKPDWSLQHDDIVLGFFSFAKFLMYRDLDATLWPAGSKFTDRSIVRSLLADGFTATEELLGEDDFIDHHISPNELTHIVDADGSQTIAIHEARRGRNLVIQGPPGTGKSQTIANIIAAAVADGKTVLFVAEKMAALEVVKRRLDQAGVGDACLELHSNKANKRAVLAELQHTWQLGAPRSDGLSNVDTRLLDARNQLNAHPARLHQLFEPYRLSPFQVMGHLTRLRRNGRPPSDFELPNAHSWSRDHRDRAMSLLSELADRVKDIGLPIKHPWHGVGLASITPLDLERVSVRLKALADAMARLKDGATQVAAAMHLDAASTFDEIEMQARLMERVATFPGGIPQAALANPVWESRGHAIADLISSVRTYTDIANEVDGALNPQAWQTEVEGLVAVLKRLPSNYGQAEFNRLEAFSSALPRFLTAVGALRSMLGVDAPLHLNAAARMVAIGQRVSEAPDASPDAFVAAIWDRGLDQASDLAEAVAELKSIRGQLEGKFNPQAWDVDLTQARSAVAVHGKKMLKFASGEWRSAKALLKTVMPVELDPDETVRLLDLLQKGKQARDVVKGGDDLGRSAFGSDWRGERSDPKPLEDLVLWMRSLRGLGGEARRIASKLSDREAVGSLARQVGELLERIRPLASETWNDVGGDERVFPDTPTVDLLDLQNASHVLSALTQANGAYAALSKLPAPPVGERVRLLELLLLGRAGKDVVAQSDEIGRAAFGGAWRRESSDASTLDRAYQWVMQNLDIRLLTAAIEDRVEAASQTRATLAASRDTARECGDILDTLRAHRVPLLGTDRVEATRFERWAELLTTWIGAEEQLFKWAAFRGRVSQAHEMGLGVMLPKVEDGRLQPDDFIPAFEMTYYEDLLRHQHGAEPQLSSFDGDLHSRLVGEFVSLDRQRMALSRVEVVKAHHKKVPPVSGIGPVGVLRAEMMRRRGHMPIRQLMQKASPAIQALKPVFMMSPLSVAQFLPPGVLEFDLLVMDEASQIQPIDALGSIARARQVLVVGDERQLPPTQFFSKMTSGTGDGDDDDGAKVSDIESILGLFSARGLPQRMLRWHYRSRHQSLIAVSNSQFYDNKLFIVPSPYTQEAGMGLRFHLVENGVFDEGVNKIEAKHVAEEIIKHALEHPGQSLGVAAFSIKQRREIQDQLELLRRLNPSTEEFFHSHQSEPFFIKNLENVQGDERDVIFISVGYAKNAQGVMNMRFGPLGADGGERRLNVLISRAKRRCEVYSSITDEDIDLERGKGKGVFAFKLFLHFARTGRLAMAQRSERDMDSVFEEQVAAALQERGYQVHPQVGIAGFFIDLAVADEAFPGRYVIGIECDGAPYHLSRSARDRDRLRQSVLEDHGWTIHRIWSTDWFQRPKAELERLVTAIEDAKAELRTGGTEDGGSASRAVPVEIVTVERADVTEIGLVPAAAVAEVSNHYVQAEIQAARQYELHEAPLTTVASLIDQVVSIEGPIHRDEVVTRIRTAWGLQRAGGRINSHVEQALGIIVGRGDIVRNGDFLSKPGQKVTLRDRSSAPSPSLRRIELIPPEEISEGLKKLLHGSLGATSDEIVTAISRSLGFKATSSLLRDLIAKCVTGLVDRGDVVAANDVMTLAPEVSATGQ